MILSPQHFLADDKQSFLVFVLVCELYTEDSVFEIVSLKVLAGVLLIYGKAKLAVPS